MSLAVAHAHGWLEYDERLAADRLGFA